MKRPLLLRAVPPAIRQRLYWHLYHHRHRQFVPLFERAPLEFANGALLSNLVVGDVISGSIAFNGFYELDLSRRIVERASRGGNFVDVGANLGYFSILWAAQSLQSKVICFEASPRNVPMLTENIRTNGLVDRVTLIPKAAGRENGELTFDLGPPEQTGWGGLTNIATDQTVTVACVRLDEELDDERIDVLKIDVEGADTWVLQGCQSLLQRKRIKTIFFEQNPARMRELGIKPEEAMSLLRSHGYICHQDGDLMIATCDR